MANDTIVAMSGFAYVVALTLSIIKIEMELFQEIAMYLTVAGALGFLLRQIYFS